MKPENIILSEATGLKGEMPHASSVRHSNFYICVSNVCLWGWGECERMNARAEVWRS